MNTQETNGVTAQPQDPSRLTPEQIERLADLEWAMKDPEVQRLYEDKVVAAYRRKIIASGDDRNAVITEAQRITGLPRHKIPVTTIVGPRTFFAPRD